MRCPECNKSDVVKNQALHKVFFYCRECKKEILPSLDSLATSDLTASEIKEVFDQFEECLDQILDSNNHMIQGWNFNSYDDCGD